MLAPGERKLREKLVLKWSLHWLRLTESITYSLQFTVFIQTHKKCKNRTFTYQIQVGFETTNGDSTLVEHLPLHPKVKGSNPVTKICTREKWNNKYLKKWVGSGSSGKKRRHPSWRIGGVVVRLTQFFATHHRLQIRSHDHPIISLKLFWCNLQLFVIR